MLAFFILFLNAAVCSAFARMAGGGLGANHLDKKGHIDEATGKDTGGVIPFISLSWLPEVLFAVALALCVHGDTIWTVLAAISIWGGIETGHWDSFSMRPVDTTTGRKRPRLFPIAKWICERFGQEVDTPFYRWTLMGLKGALVGIPLAPAGLLLIFLWPALYEFGAIARENGFFKKYPNFPTGTEFAEYATGAVAGFLALLSTFFWVAA